MKVAEFTKMYVEAEARATDCVGGASGQGGKAFTKADRAALVSLLWNSRMTASQMAYAMSKTIGNFPRHNGRLKTFETQVNRGVLRLGGKMTGEGHGKPEQAQETFNGRIRSVVDVQPAFNRAARQLIQVGITDAASASKYLHAAFETVKIEQKIDRKAERLVAELQIGDLTKDQILLTLDRVKKSF